MPRLEAFSLTCILSRVTSSGFSPMVRRTVQHIDSAFAPIIDDFKEINGLQSTLNSQRQHRGFPPARDGSIQILYYGNLSKHWVTTVPAASMERSRFTTACQ